MEEEELQACKVSEKEWKCPRCLKILSRRQTLQDHLLRLHDLEAGQVPKKYKLYEEDASIPIPKRTKIRRLHYTVNESEDLLADCDNPEEVLEDNIFLSISDQVLDVNYDHIDMDIETEVPFDNLDANKYLFDEEYSSNLDDNIVIESLNEDMDNHEDLNDVASETVPLYLLRPSANTYMYQSSISRSESALTISAFAARFNLPDNATKGLLDLIQLHLPNDNIGFSKVNSLKEFCGFDKNYVHYHLYCDKCKKLYSDDEDLNCKTPGCSGKKNDEMKKYFVTSKIKEQISEILNRKGVWESITGTKILEPTTCITNVYNGTEYRKLLLPGGFLYNSNNITLSMFTDGVPLFKSSGVQMWPVYFLINEIPSKERFQRKNMILWGLWQGCGKPNMNMFLRPLVIDLIDFYRNGIVVRINNEEILVKGKLILLTMDLQARAYLTCMTQHNGQYGCLYCEEPGVVVESGKGYSRSYINTEEVSLRTDKSIREQSYKAFQTGKTHLGFQGLSVLLYIPEFSFDKNIVVDYMHGTLLGVCKKFLDLWFDKKFKGEKYYIGQHIKEIDKILTAIKPPYIIHRIPRSLTTCAHWKASEYRNFLLFYSVPLLENYLPQLYLKHLCCLVEATFILLSEGITDDELRRAERMINFFIDTAPNLYGKNFVNLNVHNLLHQIQCVKMWGPLWGYSCFSFESFNGEIKRGIHGTGNVSRQVFWIFQAQKRIMHENNKMREGQAKDFIDGLFDTNIKKSNSIEANQCLAFNVYEVKTLRQISQMLFSKLLKMSSALQIYLTFSGLEE